MNADGSILNAIEIVIRELVSGEKSKGDILYSWDKARGSDKLENYIHKDEIIKFLNRGEV